MRQLKITKSITNRESASLDKYLQEIGREDLITVEEEVALAQRIRKGDEVVVIAGRDKGTKGTVLSRVDERHVIVEGVNVVKKHVRPNPQLGVAGGIVDKTMPIDQSNVMLVNPETGKGDRVGFKEVDGKKVRVFKSNGAVVGAKA